MSIYPMKTPSYFSGMFVMRRMFWMLILYMFSFINFFSIKPIFYFEMKIAWWPELVVGHTYNIHDTFFSRFPILVYVCIHLAFFDDDVDGCCRYSCFFSVRKACFVNFSFCSCCCYRSFQMLITTFNQTTGMNVFI